jgi:hypothetical protein
MEATVDSRLLDQLAAEGAAGPSRQNMRARAGGIGWGLAAAAALALGWLGVRQDISAASGTGVFWIKLSFPLLLAQLAAWAVWRSAHPGASMRVPLTALAATVILFWALTLLRPLLSAAPVDWSTEFWGRTWRECAFYIALMALPIWLPAMAWMRHWGPTLPRTAGALVGLCCGTASAALYALHCRESGLPFVGAWYLLGALIPAALGAVAGRRWLNW